MAASHRTDISLSRSVAKPIPSTQFTSRTWDDAAMVEELRLLWTQNTLSVSGIARFLWIKYETSLRARGVTGMTPNMVTGKSQRMGLGKKPERIKDGRAAARNRAAARPPRSVPSPAPAPQMVRVLTPGAAPMMVEKKPEPQMRRVSLLALAPTMCRWPVGDPQSENFHFCGCETNIGKSYCGYHHRLSTTSNIRRCTYVKAA
jgi:GcrA cell cycle regulator